MVMPSCKWKMNAPERLWIREYVGSTFPETKEK